MKHNFTAVNELANFFFFLQKCLIEQFSRIGCAAPTSITSRSKLESIEQGSNEKHDMPQRPQVESKVFTDEELISLIDPILKMDDTSNDGYIDYPEFIRAQQKAAANQQQPHH